MFTSTQNVTVHSNRDGLQQHNTKLLKTAVTAVDVFVTGRCATHWMHSPSSSHLLYESDKVQEQIQVTTLVH